MLMMKAYEKQISVSFVRNLRRDACGNLLVKDLVEGTESTWRTSDAPHAVFAAA